MNTSIYQKRLCSMLGIMFTASTLRFLYLYLQLTVSAEDLSYPFRSSTASVVVNIIRNNNSPVFTNNANYDVTISETYPVLNSILNVTATDIDDGRNGLVRYSFSTSTTDTTDAQNVFGINSVTGQIFARVSLLQTTRNVYTVSKLINCSMPTYYLHKLRKYSTVAMSM